MLTELPADNIDTFSLPLFLPPSFYPPLSYIFESKIY